MLALCMCVCMRVFHVSVVYVGMYESIPCTTLNTSMQ